MPISQKTIKSFILYFVALTFIINIVNLVNTEIYNHSGIKEYNQNIAVNSGIVGEKEFCLALKQSFGGMVIYRELFPLSFFMIVLSIIFILLGFILTVSNKRILSKDYRIALALFAPFIFFSWAILLYSWMGVESYFYNCTKFFSLL